MITGRCTSRCALLLSVVGSLLLPPETAAQTTVDTLAAFKVVAPRTLSAKRVSSTMLNEFGDGMGLWGLRDATLIGNETIALIDWGQPRVQLFAYTGEGKGEIGRKGRAIGELSAPHQVVSCGNGNVTVLDIENRAVVEFSRDGVLHFSLPLVAPPQTLACWPTGDAVAVFVRADSLGALRANVWPLDTLDVPPVPLLSTDAGETLLLGARLQIGASTRGVWYGTGNTPEINFQPWPRGELRVDSVGVGGRPVLQVQRTSAIDVILAEAPATRVMQQQLRMELQRAPMRKTLPAYRAVRVDPVTGDAWVVTSPVGRTRLEVTVLSASGNARGQIQLPGGWELLSVRNGEALVLAEDDNGRGTRLTVYRLEGFAPSR